MEKHFWVYILSSQRNGTLYIGITNNLPRRVWEHREGIVKGFTKDHDVHCLVYYEEYPDSVSAIAREKQLKKWNRDWKTELIEKDNPQWLDLYDTFNN